MLRVVVVDDEQHVLNRFTKLAATVPELIVCGLFQSGAELLNYVVRHPLDAVFLDIEMPEWNGLALADEIRKHQPGVQIVFLTAYQEYAVQAFEVNARDYILKPLTQTRLQKTVQRLMTPHTSGAFAEMPFIQMFGSFDVWHQGAVLSCKHARVKEMLAYLVHKDGVSVTGDNIAAVLWPESEPKKARSNFHTTAFMLRNWLTVVDLSRIYQSERNAYRVNPATFTSDVKVFEKLLTVATVKNGQRKGILQQLLTVYRGGYLAENSYEWATRRAAELERLYQQTLELLQFQLPE